MVVPVEQPCSHKVTKIMCVLWPGCVTGKAGGGGICSLGTESSPTTSGWAPGKPTVTQMGYGAVPGTLGIISSLPKKTIKVQMQLASSTSFFPALLPHLPLILLGAVCAEQRPHGGEGRDTGRRHEGITDFQEIQIYPW